MMPHQDVVSPQPYMFPNDTVVGRNPSPIDVQQNYNFPSTSFVLNTANTPNTNLNPAINQQVQLNTGMTNFIITPQNWNVQGMEENAPNNLNSETFALPEATSMNIVDSTPAGLSSVLDLDSRELTQLNSAELAGYMNLYDGNLSENLSNNLSLSDVRTNAVQQDENHENMTDSFTRLTTATIDSICNLNNM